MNITGWWEHEDYIGLQQVVSGCCLRSHTATGHVSDPWLRTESWVDSPGVMTSSSSSSPNLCQGTYPIKVEWGCKHGKRSENEGRADARQQIEIQYGWQRFSAKNDIMVPQKVQHPWVKISSFDLHPQKWQVKFMGKFLIHHQLKWEWPFHQLNI